MAKLGAAVQIVRIAIIALFSRPEDSVATNIDGSTNTRPACAVRSLRTPPARFDAATLAGTSVARTRVTVIADFARVHFAIAADPNTNAKFPRIRACISGFDAADSRAAIARGRVLVIALLGFGGLNNAVAAVLDLGARLARLCAHPACFQLT